MNGRVGTFHCRYRVIRPHLPAPAAVRPVDEVARRTLMSSLSEALDEALGGDQAVYVVRRVHVALVHDITDPRASLGRRWGETLTRAVVAAIAGSSGGGETVVRFDDSAQYQARFLADLVNGVAWERWYYGSFAPLRHEPVHEVVRRVLLDSDADPPATLASLHQQGYLGRVLSLLDPATQTLLWQASLDPPEATLPLVEAALRMADLGGWWVGGRPQAERVLNAYLATRPMPGNWRDRAELTATVVAVLRMLAERGDLRLPEDVVVEQALVGLDWLDGPSLSAGLASSAGLPVRPTDGLTPRQRLLIEKLSRVWRPDLLVPGRLDTPGNALALLAALVGGDASWSGDVTAATMIERVLAAAERQRSGKADVASAHTRWGLDAVKMIETIAAPPSQNFLDTPCAGAFLVLRAVTDGRVTAVTRHSALPRLGLVVLTLAMRWAGIDAVSAGRADVALCRLAGLEGGLPLVDLRDSWTAVPADAIGQWAEEVLDVLNLPDRPAPEPGGELGLPAVDDAIGMVADGLLRHWARWLRGFAASSSGYLLANFVRRPGRLLPDGPDLLMELAPRPLDEVLSLAGYLDDWDATPVFGGGHIRFRTVSP